MSSWLRNPLLELQTYEKKFLEIPLVDLCAFVLSHCLHALASVMCSFGMLANIINENEMPCYKEIRLVGYPVCSYVWLNPKLKEFRIQSKVIDKVIFDLKRS